MPDVIDLIERAREAYKWHEAENDTLSEGVFNEMIDALEQQLILIAELRTALANMTVQRNELP